MQLYSKFFVFGLLLIILLQCFEAAIFGGLGIAGGAIVVGTAINWGRCHFKECCNAKWTQLEKDKMEILNDFNMNLFGQHLVMQTVPNIIYNHLRDKSPQKALVLSFHGWTGCGKNHVAHLISRNIYREGETSIFVHTKIASEHYPVPSKTEEYKTELQDFIRNETLKCGRSLFIFDEMDKMPFGLANKLKSYIDYHPHVDGIDFRKNIFIFLNNVGKDDISEVALQNFRDGHEREHIKSSKMENILSLSSLKNHGGFQSSELILSGLVDFFIPFFPLEKLHVKQCAHADIQRRINSSDPDSDLRKLKQDEIDNIVDKAVKEIQFYPKGEDVFALTGCKHVTKKVDMFL